MGGRQLFHAFRDAEKRDLPWKGAPATYKGHWLALRKDGSYEICWKDPAGKVRRRNTQTMCANEAERRMKMFVQNGRAFPAFLNLNPDLGDEMKDEEKQIVEVGSASWLRARMRQHSIQAVDLAKRLNINSANIYLWRKKGVSANQLPKVCEIFGVEPPKGDKPLPPKPAAKKKAARKKAAKKKPPLPAATDIPTPEQAFLYFKRALNHHCMQAVVDDPRAAQQKLEVVIKFDDLWNKECQNL